MCKGRLYKALYNAEFIAFKAKHMAGLDYSPHTRVEDPRPQLADDDVTEEDQFCLCGTLR